jgi:hypothetical protein
MCAECRSNPCDPRCPNADEPEPLYVCEICDAPCFGDDCYFINGMIICEDCVEDMKIRT